MTRSPVAGSTSQGLAFLALLSLVGSFFAARIFTTFNPEVVVVSSGIHFHHFWYGLVMLVVAGWLAIASNRPEYDRVYAVVFGLGLGLVGDETGLLLTFGDYHSDLTYFIFVAGFCLAVVAFLALRYWSLLKGEIILLGRGERTAHIGLFVSALSAFAFAFDHVITGFLVLAAGITIIVAGVWLHRH